MSNTLTPILKSPVCMIAYANYFTDARIKKYVHALLKQGVEVDVFALGKVEACPPGMHFYCLANKVISERSLPYLIAQLRFLIFAFFLIGRKTLQRHYSLVHIHNMPDFIVFSALIPRLFGARLILDIHDTMPEAYATKMDIPLSHPIIRMIRLEERLSAAFVHHVITTNDLHKEALVEHGIQPGKISVIMNLGNDAIFYPRQRPNSHTGLTLAYHGTIAARLGVDLILEAIHRALPHCPNLRFLLIGEGEFMPVVRSLIDQYALQDVVQQLGWMPVEELPDYLAQADVGVVGIRGKYESCHNWGFPVKMLEFTSMEIPVIAPRLRVIRHYFDEDAAFFYQVDDAEDFARRIIDIYQAPLKLEQVRNRLKTFNRQYCWTLMEQDYLQIVAGLCAPK